MKKIIIFSIAFCFAISSFGQNLSKITIGRGGTVEVIGIALESNTYLYIGKTGNIEKYGFDRYGSYGQENYLDTLDPYMGRVDYYTATDDAAFRGKIKYIGRYQVNYYASYDLPELQGKIKSIGSLNFDYYQAYDNDAFKGNIKAIGQQAFSWYASYENEGSRGKLKSIGSTNITYYGSFDDKAYSGKVKSLGSVNYVYYSSLDLQQYRGALKSGQQTQTLNSVKYFVRN